MTDMPTIRWTRRALASYMVVGAVGLAIGAAVTLRVADHPTPAPAPVPVAQDAPTPLALGQTYTIDGLTTTVLASKPIPDVQLDGEVRALHAVEIRTCLDASAEARQVSADEWALEWPDGTEALERWSGVTSPEYPFRAKTLLPGHCARGWIALHVPQGQPTVAVLVPNDDPEHPVEWSLR